MEAQSSKKRNIGDVSIPSCVAGVAPQISSMKSSSVKIEENIELDEHKIAMRLKQISYGKNTAGYDAYIAAVPRNKRGSYSEHPRTPDPTERISKRLFDGRVKAWRRQLHAWDKVYAEKDSIVKQSDVNITVSENHDTIENTSKSQQSDVIHVDNAQSSIIDMVLAENDNYNSDDDIL